MLHLAFRVEGILSGQQQFVGSVGPLEFQREIQLKDFFAIAYV